MTFVRPANRAVLGYVRQHEDEVDPVRRQSVALGASGSNSISSPWKGRLPLEMLGRTHLPARSANCPIMMTLGPVRLLLVRAPGKSRSRRTSRR